MPQPKGLFTKRAKEPTPKNWTTDYTNYTDQSFHGEINP
jgi:hypothetical protein